MNQPFENTAKLIAMYLPQYHPIPENDQWWGKGFTEWTNVRKSEPRFPGHYQPHVPERLGYYDLRDPDARQAQAELAREYGIHGFCYYHYWFNGKRLLETPFNEVLFSGKPDFPFCLCWANENWTRRWDGQDQEVLMAQNYSDEDSLAFITSLIPAFRDERYIRVNGRPLLLVYRTGLLPDAKRTAAIWREAMQLAGVGDLYLVRVENFMHGVEPDPQEVGFDAAMEFAPYWGAIGSKMSELKVSSQEPLAISEEVGIYDYEQCVRNMINRTLPHYKLFRGVFPGWDNSPRKKNGPGIFVNYSPEKYAFWLSLVLKYTVDTFVGDERLAFVNAWNEWGEGCHLEPDEKHGTGYLQATRLALRQSSDYDFCAASRNSLLNLDEDAVTSWFAHMNLVYGDESIPADREVAFLRVFSNYLQERRMPGATINTDLRHNELLEQQNALLKELRSAQRINEEIRSSLSWRATAPIRSLLSRLRGK